MAKLVFIFFFIFLSGLLSLNLVWGQTTDDHPCCNFDSRAWKKDKNACDTQRVKLLNCLPLLAGKSQKEVYALLGKPDFTVKYKNLNVVRAYYYILPSNKCKEPDLLAQPDIFDTETNPKILFRQRYIEQTAFQVWFFNEKVNRTLIPYYLQDWLSYDIHISFDRVDTCANYSQIDTGLWKTDRHGCECMRIYLSVLQTDFKGLTQDQVEKLIGKADFYLYDNQLAYYCFEPSNRCNNKSIPEEKMEKSALGDYHFQISYENGIVIEHGTSL